MKKTTLLFIIAAVASAQTPSTITRQFTDADAKKYVEIQRDLATGQRDELNAELTVYKQKEALQAKITELQNKVQALQTSNNCTGAPVTSDAPDGSTKVTCQVAAPKPPAPKPVAKPVTPVPTVKK